MSKHVEMHVHSAVAKGDNPLLIIGIDEVIGRVKQLDFAMRLAACWNACREFDDPVVSITVLRARATSAEQRISSANDEAAERERTIERLSECVKIRNNEQGLKQEFIDQMHSCIETLREDLSKSETCVEVLQDQLRVNKLAYNALRDWAIGKTPVCPDLRPKPESAQPEVNVQDGAYHPFLKSTVIGPGIETTSYVGIQPLTDPIEESLETLADLVELWNRNRAKGRSAASIRGAILLAVADISRLTTGCQAK